MKIVVVELVYVRLSNVSLLAQNNGIIGIDICEERVNSMNLCQSPIIANKFTQYFEEQELNLFASTILSYVVVAQLVDWYRNYYSIKTTNYADLNEKKEETTSEIAWGECLCR